MNTIDIDEYDKRLFRNPDDQEALAKVQLTYFQYSYQT